MKKNLTLVALLLALSATSAKAQQKVLLYETGSDVPSWAQPLSEVQKIVVGGPTLKFVSTDGSMSPEFKLKAVRKLVFGHNDITGIGMTPVTETKLRVDGDQITIEGWKAKNETGLSIYTIDGKCVLRIASWNGQPVAIASLPKGMYVLVAGGDSYKFSK